MSLSCNSVPPRAVKMFTEPKPEIQTHLKTREVQVPAKAEGSQRFKINRKMQVHCSHRIIHFAPCIVQRRQKKSSENLSLAMWPWWEHLLKKSECPFSLSVLSPWPAVGQLVDRLHGFLFKSHCASFTSGSVCFLHPGRLYSFWEFLYTRADPGTPGARTLSPGLWPALK